MFSYPFWVNDFDRVKDHRLTHPEVVKIFQQPVAFWYGAKKNKNANKNLDKSIKRLLKRTLPGLPYFVLYNLPNRDLGHYSKGGASDATEYLLFLQEFCKGIKNHKPIIIYEPDALPHTTLMETKESDFEDIKNAHIANYLTKPNNLSGEFSYLVNEWMDNKNEIDTKLEYVNVLGSVTLEQVQAYYQSLFFDEKNTQQILVQVKGQKFNKETPLTLPKEVSILDIDKLSK